MGMKSVGFLKTHKCASSSVQNILLRWGVKHGLNFVLPAEGNYLRSENRLRYSRDMVGDTPWEKSGVEYQIFCLHTVWDTQEVVSTLSGTEKVLISIVRDPVDVFESMWHYYNFSQQLGKSLEDFAKEVSINPYIERLGWDKRFGRNQTLFDFGLEHDMMDDDAKINEKIRTIEKDFDLVMVSERFLESKILLASLLDLSPSEAACLKLNSRNSSAKPGMDSQTRKLLSAWLAADYQLYTRANTWLDQKLDSLDQEYKTELAEKLEAADGDLERKCKAHKEGSKLGGDYAMWSNTVVGYTPTGVQEEEVVEGLKLACMGELQFIDWLRRKQAEKC